jgi:hypothetical protein
MLDDDEVADRLTPVYAVILFFVATLMVYIGTGPEWYYIVSGSKACRENWWQHLLYSNYNKAIK